MNLAEIFSVLTLVLSFQKWAFLFCFIVIYGICLLSICRVNCRVGNMSQKALKTCRLPLWGCCVGKTPARPSLQSEGPDQSVGLHISNY